MFLDQILVVLSCKNMETHTHAHTHTHTDSDEYSIDAFCKNATIITQHTIDLCTPKVLRTVNLTV